MKARQISPVVRQYVECCLTELVFAKAEAFRAHPRLFDTYFKAGPLPEIAPTEDCVAHKCVELLLTYATHIKLNPERAS